MRSQTILALAASALSGRALAQDLAGATSCTNAINSLQTAVPTPADSALLSLITSAAADPASLSAAATDPCFGITAVPSSLSSAALSYQSQLQSFASAHGSEVAAAASLCGSALSGIPGLDPAAISSQLQMLTAYAATTCITAADSTPTEGGAASTPNAAVARPTGGVAAGVAAAAGILGAVAML